MIRLKLNILVYVGGERHAIVYSRYLVLFHPSLSYLKFKKKIQRAVLFWKNVYSILFPLLIISVILRNQTFVPLILFTIM